MLIRLREHFKQIARFWRVVHREKRVGGALNCVAHTISGVCARQGTDLFVATSRAADAMHVVLARIRIVVVDDQGYIIDICRVCASAESSRSRSLTEATRRHIGREHNRLFALFKLCNT